MNKNLVFLLIVLVILGIFYFGYQVSKSTLPKNTSEIPTSSMSSPAEITQKFYDAFTSCMINPPKEAEGMVGNYCQANTGMTSKNFSENIQSSPMADSTTCSQNPPLSIKAGSENINADSAIVDVAENFGDISQTLHISLVKEDGNWKVDNIVCPSV